MPTIAPPLNVKLESARVPGDLSAAWKGFFSTLYAVQGGDTGSVFFEGSAIKTNSSSGLLIGTAAADLFVNGYEFTTTSIASDTVLYANTDNELVWENGFTLLTPYTTGEIILGYFGSIPTGFIQMDDGTIGSASSGATNRANADTEALYTLLWNSVSNTYAPVSSGRGASAAADFAANKTLTLPPALGRALGVAGAGSGLTSRAVGQYLGTETETLTIPTMPSHKHSYPNYRDEAGSYDSINAILSQGSVLSSTATSSATGSDSPHNNVQPSIVVYGMIKL